MNRGVWSDGLDGAAELVAGSATYGVVVMVSVEGR
jgi:hypothetical protein